MNNIFLACKRISSLASHKIIRILSGLYALFCFILFSACSEITFNEPVREFFEYYTNSAQILEHSIIGSIGTGNTGIDFIESNENKRINFVLRNPQRYSLVFTYNFHNSLIAAKAEQFSDAVVFTMSENKESATLTFGKDFLQSIDNGDVYWTNSAGEVVTIKDLSGTITLKEEIAQREFESYEVSVMVNSPPPRLRGGMYQRNKAQNESGTQYIICFNLPDLRGTLHEKDTKNLYIGGELYRINFDEYGNSDFITRPDGGTVNLSTTRPSELLNVNSTVSIFEPLNPSTDFYIPLYYATNLVPDLEANMYITNTLTLSDDFGFSQSVNVYSQIDQWNPVTLNVVANPVNQYCVNETSGLFNLRIEHDSSFKRTTSESQGTGNDEYASVTPIIEYRVYRMNGATPVEYASGRGSAPITIPVEKGKYYVDAFATYVGFIDSRAYSGFASSSSNPVQIYQNEVYYVSANAADGGNGSYSKPYNSIQTCVKEILNDAKDNFISSGYVINLLTDISAKTSDTFDSSENNSSLIYFNKASEISAPGVIKFTVNGNGHKIDALRTGNDGRVITAAANTEVILNNVTISGGNISEGAGMYINGGTVTLQGGTRFTGNTAASKGGAIYLNSGILNLNGSTITGNMAGSSGVAGVSGGGIYYYNGTINIQNTNIVKDNTETDGTTASNLYIYHDELINITGVVTGSTIRFAKDFANAAELPDIGRGVPLTQNYNYNNDNPSLSWSNTDMPGRVFKNDAQGSGVYPIVEEGGEAVFVMAGAGIHTAYDFIFDFTMDREDEVDHRHKFYVGHKKVFTITPEVRLVNTPLTYNETSQCLRDGSTKYYDGNGNEARIEWSAKLYCGRELTEYAPTVYYNQITIPETLPWPDTFVLQVTATYMGVPHTKDFTIYGIEAPQTVNDFAQVQNAINTMTGNSLELLATEAIYIPENGAFNIPAGKTVKIIRSDDMSPYVSMFTIYNGGKISSKNGGSLIIDGTGAKGYDSLVTSASCELYNVTIQNYTNIMGAGGALSIGVNNFLNMYNCTVKNCHARAGGGALHIPGSAGGFEDPNNTYVADSGIINCTFINCTTQGNGGAILKSDNNGHRFIILNNCTFTGCSAASGNKIYIGFSQWECKLYIDESVPVFANPTYTVTSSTPYIMD